ncbi:MAG: glycoside hydrolase family 2 TIM barrel-domain containing protein [Tissierellia bacterium]|nr:glycoside hydrolase family 2 TIM barrel-domain containing protein [Tissierellia bacterium]
MRKIIPILNDWTFIRESEPRIVQLPHQWNEGADEAYFGTCTYMKQFTHPGGKKVYLEVLGAINKCTVFVNGNYVGDHAGGMNAFRLDITAYLKTNNELTIDVDNTPDPDVFPNEKSQLLHGGLYGGVQMISVGDTHFSMDMGGSDGLFIYTNELTRKTAELMLRAYITNPQPGQYLNIDLYDAPAKIIAHIKLPVQEHLRFPLYIPYPHLWQGPKDPFLYKVKAQILDHDMVVDELVIHYGIRLFSVSTDQGFYLNHEPFPMRGIHKHSSDIPFGSATSEDLHSELFLLKGMGANALHFHHAQNLQFSYNVADQMGFFLWPGFRVTKKESEEFLYNLRMQMRELILQNFNHPSIIFWGLGHEEEPGCDAMYLSLNNLCHHLDPTRLTMITRGLDSSEVESVSDLLSLDLDAQESAKLSEQWLEREELHPLTLTGIHFSEDNFLEDYRSISKLDKTAGIMSLFFNERNQSEPPSLFDGVFTRDMKKRKNLYYIIKSLWSDEPFLEILDSDITDEDTRTIFVATNQVHINLWEGERRLGKKNGPGIVTFPLPKGISNVWVSSGELRQSTVYLDQD